MKGKIVLIPFILCGGVNTLDGMALRLQAVLLPFSAVEGLRSLIMGDGLVQIEESIAHVREETII